MELADRLLSCARDTKRGLYVPLASDVATRDKLTEFDSVPAELSASEGTHLRYFCNALLLPSPRPTNLCDGLEIKPSLRVTNAGFLVITVEHDHETVEGLEESIEWTSTTGKLRSVDGELRHYRDYSGYCAVWSGHRSVHLHFVFDTTHLVNASSELSAPERWAAYVEEGALMEGVYATYYDTVARICTEVLCPTVPPDNVMRRSHQFRRMPWGLRTLEKDSDILGLPVGTVLPQLVLCENIRSHRSAKGSQQYLAPPDIKHQVRPLATKSSAMASWSRTEVGSELIGELRQMCRAEWGREFPKPVRMWRDRDDWVVNFQNRPADKNPSTVCRGDYNRLLIQGRDAPDGQFVLPGELTANELGTHLALRFGLIRHRIPVEIAAQNGDRNLFARLKSRRGRTIKQAFEEGLRDNFPVYTTMDQVDLQAIYRDRLRRACATIRSFNMPAVIKSAEGIGKTRSLFEIMADEALDTALEPEDGRVRFNAFAFRSEQQAIEKAGEYQRETARRAFVWRPFWSHYADACRWANTKPIIKAAFDHGTDVLSLLREIRHRQPAVSERLEEVRKSLWRDQAGKPTFNTNTMVFTTHATVMSWVESRVTRTWHHPEFGPSITAAYAEPLRDRTILRDVVFDEPEFGEFVWLLTSELHAHLVSVNESDWKHTAVEKQRDLFERVRRSGAIPPDMKFEAYSELRYLDLSTLERVDVDYWSQPFGRENSTTSIYRSWHQKPFYLGVKRWPFSGSARITYLTTEAFTAEVIAAIHEKARRPLFELKLEELPPLYPIDVSLVKDPRARAVDIQELANEILADSDTAVVIADGLEERWGGRTMTFQGMKGHNGLANKDVFIIATFLASEVYAKLNVLGQWIGQTDTVAKYYAAQISQAIGRNTGFRQRAETKTVVIMSDGLLRQIGPKFDELTSRFVLRPTPDPFW
jgi:hypothetical protein